jgi:hypothetical protein
MSRKLVGGKPIYSGSVADSDPRSSAFLTPGFGIRIRDVKNSDPRFGIRDPKVQISDHISESSVTIFCVENTLFFVNSVFRIWDPCWKFRSCYANTVLENKKTYLC